MARILIAEDEPDIRELVAFVLRFAGHEVTATPNGEEALNQAGIIIPEAHGGSNFGFLSAGLVVEELGKTLTASPLVVSTIVASAIVLGGSDQQKDKWLPKLASGETVATLAVDEGPHYDPSAIETNVSDGKLTGKKAFVHEAHDLPRGTDNPIISILFAGKLL